MGLVPGAYMSANVLVMQNIPSGEGYRYVFFIVDHASKMSWVYSLQTREYKHILGHLRTLIQATLPSLNIPLRLFHSDGGAEVVASRCCLIFTQLVQLPPTCRGTRPSCDLQCPLHFGG